ncbi:MAG TPA: PDZ domain-containing protein, partial [Symbiobacteriaceae bacterium]|nr:PDZ domain-containing protein [Symbiobacteriaceae bacterium]
MLLLVSVLLVFLQYRRIAVMETELFGVAKHSPLEQTMHSLLMGVLGGVVGSIAMSVAGAGLVDIPGAASALLYLWPVSVLLGALNPRFFCFAYSSTLLSLCYLLTGSPRMDVPAVVGMVAVMHMVEALLIWASGATCATPMSIDSRLDESVPGFMLQRFWPVPFILPVFSTVHVAPLAMPAWWPLLRPDPALLGGATLGWQLIPAVVTMGYSDLAIAAPPEVRARQSSRLLLLYSGTLLLLALGSVYFRPLTWVAALFCGFGHEAMAVWSGRAQMLGMPYLRRPAKGVAVLDVLPGSAAAAGGLCSGAVIVTVDDFEVHSRAQLHEALMASPANVRIMWRKGRQLEQCRLPRPAEGLFGFGVILLPEPGDRPLAKLRRPAFFRWSG